MAHQPTPESRKTVENGSGLGLPQQMIADLLDISEKTLRARYKKELRLGRAKATVNVLQTLYKRCLAGSDTAIIWYTKTQLGWHEPKAPTVLTTPPGQPFPMSYVPAAPQLLQDYYAKIAQAAAAADADPAAPRPMGSDGSDGEEPGGGEGFSPR